MVTWNAGSDAFFAPAVLGMVDAAEACLILEHKAHFSTAPVEIFQFTDGGFNFFEVSYYFLIKILILIRKASPDGAACFVIYKERNHKTSLI